MWIEILCCLIIYKLFKVFFYNDDTLDLEASDSRALFSVAHRLEKLYEGKVYVGLRIPDAETSSKQSVEMIHVSERELVVISVRNYSGFLSVRNDGFWVLEGGSRHKAEIHPDPVEETKRQAAILSCYLEQRGIALPEGYVSCKVVLSNPKLCTINANFPPEVVTHDQWVQLKQEKRGVFSSLISGAFHSGKKEMEESIYQKLDAVLSKAPMWDRLEVKGNKIVLGEFLEFKGKEDDIEALRSIKRSKVARVEVQKTSMLGLAPSKLQVLYFPRDYTKAKGYSASEYMEVTVRSNTEIVFEPENAASKVRKFKLSSVTSLSLSA